mgnify:CR=1 FL=1
MLRYQFDKAKPFRSRHAQQIKLIDEPVLPVRDLDTAVSGDHAGYFADSCTIE